MGQFQVTGSNSSGREVKIYVEADSPKSARLKARNQGIIPMAAVAVDAAQIAKSVSMAKQITSGAGGVKYQDLSSMTRQLASLIKAHVPVVESFSALIEQIDNVRLKSVLTQIRQTVKEGRSLGEGFEQFPKIFNKVYVNMVKAGESSGRLDVVLLRLADFQENQVKLKNRVMGAMMYPIIMVVVGTLIMGVIFVKVIPQITKIFTDMKTELPMATRFLIWASDFLQVYGLFLLFGVLGLGVLLERYIATEAGRRKKDAFLLKVPVLRDLVRVLAIARFSRTLGTLLQSGVPMLGALQITRNVVNHANFEVAIEEAATQVSEGRSLSGAIKQSGEFPPIVIHMIGVGEKTGELEPMLLNVASDYDQQMDLKLGTLTGLLEPLMIVVMAGAVGFIVMAVLLPIFNMNEFGS